MKIFQAFSLLTIAHGSKVTRINFRKEGEGLGSRLYIHTYKLFPRCDAKALGNGEEIRMYSYE